MRCFATRFGIDAHSADRASSFCSLLRIHARVLRTNRCFLALASNQLKLRTVLESRRLGILQNAFSAWKTGLGVILRSRLLPAQGEQNLLPSPPPESASAVDDANGAPWSSFELGVSSAAAAAVAAETEADTCSVVSIEVSAAPMPGEADWQEVVWNETVEDDGHFAIRSLGGSHEDASTTGPSMTSMMSEFAGSGERRGGEPRMSVSESVGGLAEAAIAVPPPIEGAGSRLHHEGTESLSPDDDGFDDVEGEDGWRVDVDAVGECGESDAGGRGDSSSRRRTASGDGNVTWCEDVDADVSGDGCYGGVEAGEQRQQRQHQQQLLLPSAFFVSSVSIPQPSAPSRENLRARRRRDRHDGGQGAP